MTNPILPTYHRHHFFNPALGLHLAQRLQEAWRGRSARSSARSSALDGVSAPPAVPLGSTRCAFVRRDAPELQGLPKFPTMPAEFRLDPHRTPWRMVPIPRLLPRERWEAASGGVETHRTHFSAGVGAGVSAGALAWLCCRLFIRRRSKVYSMQS